MIRFALYSLLLAFSGNAFCADEGDLIDQARAESAKCIGTIVGPNGETRRSDQSIACSIDAFAEPLQILYQRHLRSAMHKEKSHSILTLGLTISPSGEPSITIVDNGLGQGAEEFVQKIVAVLSAVEFAPIEGAEWTGEYPINFFPSREPLAPHDHNKEKQVGTP